MTAAAPVERVDRGGRSLATRCSGIEAAGPTIVLETGAGSAGLDRWGRLERDLHALGPTVTYDRQGVGQSDPATTPPSLAAWAEDLDAVIAHHADGPALLVGWSLGAAIAVAAAGRRPDLVAGMVLVDPFTPLEGAGLRAVYRALAPVSAAVTGAVTSRAAGRTALGRRAQERLVRTTGLGPEHELWPLLVDDLRSGRGRQALRAETRDVLRLSDDYVAALRATALPDVPVVVLSATDRGRQQRLGATIRAGHERLVERFPRGVLVEATSCGHHVPYQRPEVVVAAVRQVLGALR